MIYHLAEPADWEQALRDGSYTRSTRWVSLEEEGFIHASSEEQWPVVRSRFYSDVTGPLVLLHIDESRLAEEYEPTAGGAEKLGAYDTYCLRLKGKPGLDLAFPELQVWIDTQTKNILLGTAFSADRVRAKFIGYVLHFVAGIVFALAYYAVFVVIGRAGWRLGLVFGLAHALFAGTVLVNVMLPVVHPRMATFHRAANGWAGPLLFLGGACGLLHALYKGSRREQRFAAAILVFMGLLALMGAATVNIDFWRGPSPLYFEFFLWPLYALYAAPEFLLDARTWWYPFIGTAKYRGYFNEKMAREEAQHAAHAVEVDCREEVLHVEVDDDVLADVR